MRELAARYGLDYTGLGERYPCTLPAHALIDWAHGFNLHWQLSEAFYKASLTLPSQERSRKENVGKPHIGNLARLISTSTE